MTSGRNSPAFQLYQPVETDIMHIVSYIFLQLFSFCAGGMAFVNLTELTPGAGEGYEASWFNILIFVCAAIVTSRMSYMKAKQSRYL